MGWIFYTAATVVAFAGWGFVGVFALRDITAAQATILFGIASVLVGVVYQATSGKEPSWNGGGLALGAASGLAGSIGLVTFYLALDKGKASLVVPLVGVYPVIVAVMAVLFLSERLSALQAFGILLAVTGVVLVGTGG